ncbi:MAG TPA: ArsA family ATPase [Thermoanaerobaculia bacterium]|jgi:anion-transporting  ArsA/GET3 family ATPase|nr:ArsA family ATPase [Thermoanaerobaculia bacterium]
MDIAARLGRLQLLVVTGKGGVGKTAAAASLGRLLAAAGRRVLVLEVDPRENVHQMLAVPPSGGAIVRAGTRLWVQNLKPGQVLDDIVRERLKVEMLARRVLASPVYEQFSAGAPGLKELAILGHALRLLRRVGPPDAPQLDLVVLDAPATGHGVRLLAAPRLVSEVIGDGPFGALAGELAGFVADPERCGIVVVTQAEEMPVEEALELREALASQLGREPELLIVNGLFPPLPAGLERPEVFDPVEPLLPPAPPPAPEMPLGAELLTFWRHRRFLNERELERLARWWEGPRIELPLLALERGPALTDALQQLLAAGLAPGAGVAGAEQA